jgi:hypothetical protein
MVEVIQAFTPICEDDAHWIPQYLAEAERLDLRFAMHFDRCSNLTKHMLLSHRLCVGGTQQNDPDREYDETAKQVAMDIANTGVQWVLHWDMDETWNVKDLAELERSLPSDALAIDVRWVNLWEDDRHIRTDGVLGGYSATRTKLYRSTWRRSHTQKWVFRSPLVYGPSLMQYGRALEHTPAKALSVHCQHHGYKTRELRLQHKARWDRVYGAHHDGVNPYGTWAFLCDESITPTVEEYP